MASVTKFDPMAQSTVVSAQEGAGTQAFKAGDLLKFDASGQVVAATAGVMHAIALADAAGVTSTALEIELLDPTAVYIAYYKASATSQALVGDTLDFTFTAGAHTLDEGSGASTDTYCVGLYDAVGTSGGRLMVRFPAALFLGL